MINGSGLAVVFTSGTNVVEREKRSNAICNQ
jgi:hypothetical protein